MAVDFLRCRLRLLDSFGTQAEFNDNQYYNANKVKLGGKMKNPWGGHGLELKQFYTMYRKSIKLFADFPFFASLNLVLQLDLLQLIRWTIHFLDL